MPESNETKLASLTEVFRNLGIEHPELYARGEVEHDSPALAKVAFLRTAWEGIVKEDDTTWIEQEITMAHRRPGEPCSGLGLALERLLRSGCSRADLTEVARHMQYQTLFNVCYLLDDAVTFEPAFRDVGWALFEADVEGNPGRHMSGLHEEVLMMDPTGREMRPRDRSASDQR